jgi:HemY protein
MRRLFAIVLVALLVGVGIVAIIETDPGYVLLAYGNYTLETSFWVGVLLLLLLVILLFLVLRLAYRLLRGQRSLVSWFGTRKAHHARRLSTRGLISYAEGNWARAARQLERGAQNNDAPLANYLLAARASQRLPDAGKLHEYLSLASAAEPDAAIAVELTLAEIKLEAGEYEQSLSALDKARDNVGRHPRVLELLRRAYAGLGDWENQLQLLPDLKKYKVLDPEAYHDLERSVHVHRLEAARSSLAELQSTWQSLPGRLKHDADLVRAYTRGLVALDDQETAEQALLRALKHEWNHDLLREYSLVQSADSSKQLSRAEAWLSAHPEDAQLLLCLGRLAARDSLWGKARDYFESSYRLERSTEICAELGRLLTALGEPKVAGAYYREGLLIREESRLPSLPMPGRVVPEGQQLARS